MDRRLSRRQTLREALPSIFENRKPTWPNPRNSVGSQCLSVDGLQCWQATGPALEAIQKLARPIKDLLDKHQELLEQGEPKPRPIAFHMWMIGKNADVAQPTIVFSSKSKRQRKYAKALLNDSKLLDEYPGVAIKTLDKMPAVPRSAQGANPASSANCGHVIGGSHGLCGSLVAFGQTGITTMGGVIFINGVEYGMSAQHARFETTQDLEENESDDETPCFDDDSDSEENDLTEITSRGQLESAQYSVDIID